MLLTHEIITVNNSVRPFLGHFRAHLGDKQPAIFKQPLLCYFVQFSATWQQYSRLCSLQNFYLHNLAQRCLYSFQLSNFLIMDFPSLIVRKPHQLLETSNSNCTVDITQPNKDDLCCLVLCIVNYSMVIKKCRLEILAGSLQKGISEYI